MRPLFKVEEIMKYDVHVRKEVKCGKRLLDSLGMIKIITVEERYVAASSASQTVEPSSTTIISISFSV